MIEYSELAEYDMTDPDIDLDQLDEEEYSLLLAGE